MTNGVTSAQRFYTRWAGVYDFLAERTPGIQTLRAHAIEALAPRRGDVVVDLGCGTGANFRHLRQQVGDTGTVIGVDFSPGMLSRARERVAKKGWDNVHAVCGDATNLPVTDADAVFASFVTGMLEAPEAVVHAWCDLVGRDGRIGLLDLARSTQSPGKALNGVFRGLVLASSPPGSRWPRGADADLPTETLDQRVATAHWTLHDRCSGTKYTTHALGFARVSAGTVAGSRPDE